MAKSAEARIPTDAVTPGAARRRAPGWAWATATFFGVGHLRPAPGTWGSLAACGLWLAAGQMLDANRLALATAAGAGLAIALGIPAATRLARSWGNGDPSQVVIDEVSGQLLTLLWAPAGWKSLLLGLILFRAFDILKPPPLRQLERLPGGAGIVLDDVGAGLYALAAMQIAIHWGRLL